MPHDSHADLPTVVWTRIEALIDRFEQAWRRGEHPRIEDYLPTDEHERQIALAELVQVELELRREGGDTVPTDPYRERYPELSATTFFEEGAGARQPRTSAAPSDRPAVTGYEILEELGRGGMGVVYKARHVSLDRLVALKMIRPGDHIRSEMLERFRDEALAVARFQHPNIVQIHEVGEHQGRPYCALEYVDGGSLAKKLIGQSCSPQWSAELLAKLARTVHAAHARGIIHCDLKPANVLFTADAVPKLVDFGLARRLDEVSGGTRTSELSGTPLYMAPEQARGKPEEIGPATDVYALGVMLYELLTGRAPFKGPTVAETLELVRFTEPPPPSAVEPRVPRDLDIICMKAISKEPADRYSSAQALAEDLERFLADVPIHARPTTTGERARLWFRKHREAVLIVSGALVAVFLVLAAFVYHAWRQKPPATTTPDSASLPPDLQLVPEDATGFLTIRLGDLMSTDAAARLRRNWGADGPPVWQRLGLFLAGLEQVVGLSAAQITRATFVILDPEGASDSAVFILLIREPLDIRGRLQAQAPMLVEKQHQGRQYYAAGEDDRSLAVFPVSDQVLVVGLTEPALRAFLERERGLSRWQKPLQRAAERRHVVFGFRPPGTWLQQWLENYSQELATVQSLILTVDLLSTLGDSKSGAAIQVEVQLGFPDPGQAAAAAPAVTAGLRRLADPLATILETPEDARETVLAALQSASIQVDGRTITVSFRLPLP